MVSRTINTSDAQLGMEEDDDTGLISIWITRGGYQLETTLTPDELAELGSWIQEHELEQAVNGSVAE